MDLPVFTAKKSNDFRPKGESEAWPAYLRRSSAPVAIKLRSLLDSWVALYPEAHRTRIANRLRSNDDELQSAFFELYLHALFKNLGFDVDIHSEPENGTAKRPDFLLRGPAGEELFLEATVVCGASAKDVSVDRLKRQAYDAINNLPIRRFFACLENEEGTPRSSVPTGKLCREILSWLESLEEDQRPLSQSLLDSCDSLPLFYWKHDGWQLKFRAVPSDAADLVSRPESRGLGIRKHSFGPVDFVEKIRASLRAKAGKYGELGRPYIIALNVLSPLVGPYSIQEAFFGRVAKRPVYDEEGDERWVADGPRDGFFGNSIPPQNSRVSAVLLVANVRLDNFASSKGEVGLYHHPQAKAPYRGLLNRLQQVALKEDGIFRTPGASIPDLLGYESNWLES